jgi:CRISPR-associated endonuclease Csn1
MSTDKGIVLGVDLGANSIGTALIDWSKQEILFTGVRIFKAGIDNLDEAKEASRAVARRSSRLTRRQTDRRRRRQAKIYRLLQQAGLLPPGERGGAEFQALDRRLTAKYGHAEKMPYHLRAKALDGPLDALEIGRALYHLAQRRGFLSNRKAGGKADEEQGKVKGGITELTNKMMAAGARTVGQYFGLHVDTREERIRSRYTHRSMYQAEPSGTRNNPTILANSPSSCATSYGPHSFISDRYATSPTWSAPAISNRCQNGRPWDHSPCNGSASIRPLIISA